MIYVNISMSRTKNNEETSDMSHLQQCTDQLNFKLESYGFNF